MALDQSYQSVLNVMNADLEQAGNAYVMYLKQTKKLGAAEIMTMEQFARSGSYKYYDTTPLLRKKKGYTTPATQDKTRQLGSSGMNEQEIGSLRR